MVFQLLPDLPILRHSLLDQRPESWGVIELAEVAEFVDYYVVGLAGREEGEAVAKVEVALLRTASPSGLLIADRDFLVRESVELIEMLQPLVHELASCLLML